MERATGYEIPITLITTSERQFKVILKYSTATEKHFIIYIQPAQQAIEKSKIYYLEWIKTEHNITYRLAKARNCPAFERLLDSETLQLKAQQRISEKKKSGDN